MSQQRIKCPRCRNTFSAWVARGQRINCPHCQRIDSARVESSSSSSTNSPDYSFLPDLSSLVSDSSPPASAPSPDFSSGGGGDFGGGGASGDY